MGVIFKSQCSEIDFFAFLCFDKRQQNETFHACQKEKELNQRTAVSDTLDFTALLGFYVTVTGNSL